MAAAQPNRQTGLQTLSEAPHPWSRALAWLLFLGPFFFISYGYANWMASQNENVTFIVFDWEQYIPFIPWTIIPYWVIDFMYAASLFVCRSRKELDSHAKRLLTAQIIAVACFILFPLGFSFERPETSGLTGWLFMTLGNFDQPYNQAPSLHITLLVILWVLYARHLPRSLVWPFHILCALIGVSVLTTYQHHFIDVPTGALLGWICVWMWPLESGPVFSNGKLSRETQHWRIATYYMVAALVIAYAAIEIGGFALWLLWPAFSLLLVALNYVYLGSDGFQKNANGQMSVAAKWLYFPYLLGASINSRLWTMREPKSVAISDRVHLGRMPASKDVKKSDFHAVVDMTAEFDRTAPSVSWHAIPSLDLLVPSADTLLAAARLITSLEKKGSILVTCALGYSRSALAVMAWLLVSRRVSTVDEAINIVKQQRPSIVITHDAKQALKELT